MYKVKYHDRSNTIIVITMAYEGFCVRCRKKVTIQNAAVVTLKNGRKAVKGTCPSCGGVVYRFIKG